MAPITRGQKIYFAAVGLLALWVGSWGYFIPGRVDQAIPWLVPPLHARFLGAMYLSGVAFMIGCILSRFHAEVRITIRMIVIWTGMLFIISLFYLDEFDYTHLPVWFWFGAYVIYPLIGLQMMWKYRTLQEKAGGSALHLWVKGYLLAQGTVMTLLAALLLIAPQFMVNVWPWKITVLLAQLYSAPFLSYGIGSLMLSRQQTWMEARVAVIGIFVFTFGVLLASLIHHELFSTTNMAVWVWFGGFLLATVMLGILSVYSVRESRRM